MRQSNFELLRIIAIFLVLVFHSNFQTIGIPVSREVAALPATYFMQFFVQGFSIICVNVFILLSGWFKIKPTMHGFLKLIYIVLFFLLGSFILNMCFKGTPFSFQELLTCFLLNDYCWFIKSYVCLYIISPILNSYAKTADRKSFRNLLISFFVFQSIYGWATNAAVFFNYGASVVSFCGLYLLSCYIKQYKPKWSLFNKIVDLGSYFIIVIISASTLLILSKFDCFSEHFHSFVGHMYSYSCPLVIIECVCIFLYFSKLRFNSKFVNFIAASSFSVLFVHGNKYIFPYEFKIIEFYAESPYIIALLKSVFVCIEAFILGVLLDQLRKISWSLIEKSLFRQK